MDGTLTAALARLVGLRRDELVRALPVATLYGLVLATMYVLKPARNALFLDRFGAAQLPYALLLVAAVGAVSAGWHARRSRPMPPRRVVTLLFPLLAVCLLGFWLALPHGHSALIYAFFVWVNLYGLVATSLIWLLANAVFDPREARRVFGFIGAAGIAGAILGAMFTQAAAERVGTHALLLVGASALLLGTALVRGARPLPAEPARAGRRYQSKATGAVDAIRESRLLTALVPMVACGALVSALVEIQFNAVVDEAFSSTDAKTAFFGRFFAILNAAALLFQLLLAPRLLNRLGVGTVLFALPVALVMGSVALLLFPVLASAALAKAADGGLRHSLNRSATEILFLPVPSSVKQKAKVLLDSTIDNLATGAGAILALLLTAWLSLPYWTLSVVALAATAIWLMATWGARRAYVDEFRQALSKRQIDLAELRIAPSDAASVKSLLSALQGTNERQITYALGMLETVRSAAATTALQELLAHGAASIRAHAIRVLQQQEGDAALPTIEGMVQDPDEEVRLEAVHYVCTHASRPGSARLSSFLASEDPKVAAAALGCIARHGAGESAELLAPDLVASILRRTGPRNAPIRCQLARALGSLPAAAAHQPLEALASDDDPRVILATIEAAGRARVVALGPWLMQKLVHRSTRAAASLALARIGEPILPALAAALDDPDAAPALRRSVPRVLSRIRTQATVNLLLARLPAAVPLDRTALLKALNRLRIDAPELAFDPPRLTPLLREEIQCQADLYRLGQLSPGPQSAADRLVQRAMQEKQRTCLERTFRLLALQYPPGDMYHAYLALVSGKQRARASAVEFLDNLVDRETMSLLLPVLEPDTPAEPRPPTRPAESWLTPLLGGSDAWLRACAVYASADHSSPRIRALVEACRQDPHPVVRETASLVLDAER